MCMWPHCSFSETYWKDGGGGGGNGEVGLLFVARYTAKLLSTYSELETLSMRLLMTRVV